MKQRNEIPIEDRWNVEALYPTLDAWKQEFQEVQTKASRQPLDSFKGRLKDPASTLELLNVYFDLERKLEKLHVYAHLKMDEDLGDDEGKTHFGLISGFTHEFHQKSSWIEPELLSLQDEDYQRLIGHPALSLYRFYLEKLGRMRPHTLPQEQEELIALAGKNWETARKAFVALNNADLTFAPVLDEKEKEHPLSHGAYAVYMRSLDRNLRKSAFIHLHQAYGAHINTLCELLQGQVQNLVFIAKARHFSSCLEAALFPHQIELSVYDQLIAAVRRHLPAMHRYIALRKKILKLTELHAYDLSVPLISDLEIKMDYQTACKAVVTSVAPLGKEYQQILKQGLMQERWVDIYENAKKRSGAYSSGCYDSMPYILMNYQGDINDVFTLAHEAGHSMQTYLSSKHQSYIYASYPIFVAEIASTFNEQLLMDHLKTQYKGKKEKAYLINYQIEQIRNTLFRQTLFAEFEAMIHKLAEEGTPLTPGLLKEKYLGLYRDYYGPELILDPELAFEWARIPHFYSNFYVYQYATGISAAFHFHEMTSKSSEATARYLEFLSAGGSRYPLDLLQRAGVDMRTADPALSPVDAALRQFERLVEELEGNLRPLCRITF